MSPRQRVPRSVLIALIGLSVVEAAMLIGGVAVSRRPPRPAAAPTATRAPAAPIDPSQLPIIPGARQRGVCFVAGPTPPTDADFADLAAHGVTWISQTPFGWQARADAPELRMNTAGHGWWGERDSGLVETTRLARARGIRTLLKPHVWLRDHRDGLWTGSIAMKTDADWAAWFAQYEAFIVHYATLAESMGAEALCVGTELEGTTGREADWRRVIAAVRRVYHGRLTYGANWSGEFERIAFWDALDDIGVQAYFPLSDRPDATIDELVAAWAPHVARIEAVQRRSARPVLFTEIGYKASARATHEPWTWATDDAYDPDAQARAYEAAYRALWDRPWCAGFYWWKWFPAGHHEAHGRDRFFTPQDKPAADVMAKWYTTEIPPRSPAE